MKPWKTYLGAVTVAVLVLGAGYYSYISPAAILEEIKIAAQKNDRDRLRDLIDFDSVKVGLKEDIKVQLMVSASESLKDNPFAALGVAVAGMAVDSIIESIVSPAGIARLIENGGIEFTNKGQPPEISPKASKTQGGGRVEQGYDEFSRYRVRIGRLGEKPDQLLTFTLKRVGLFGWRLTNVSIPANLLSDIANNQVSLGPQRRANLIAIEYSDVQAVSERENVIALNAVLRNQAKFAQEYPALEFALTDESDDPLARRVLLPAEYLAGESVQRIAQGIGPRADVALRMHFDISGVRATGYQLKLFYPSQYPEALRQQIRPENIRVLSK